MANGGWSQFEAFCHKAELFGYNAYLTRGLGGRNTSEEVKTAVFSLLYVKMVGVFTNKLRQYCIKHNIKNASKARLYDLLDELNKMQIINLDFNQLRRIRGRRNDIAHKPSFLVTESDFANDKQILAKEYSKL